MEEDKKADPFIALLSFKSTHFLRHLLFGYLRMLLQILKQRFRGPLVTDGAPMPVISPVGILDPTGLTNDVVVLVNDRDLSRVCQDPHPVK